MSKRKKLDMPKRNLVRAKWAERSLRLFGVITGVNPDTEGWRTNIVDFLCDLLHLLDREGLGWNDVFGSALMHYKEETRCAGCQGRLKAGDDTEQVDCVCKKCEKRLEKKNS